MFKIDGPNATIDHEFQAAVPETAQPATRVTVDWLNAVQREMVAIIAAGGVSLNKTVSTQMLTAIETLIANAIATENTQVINMIGDAIAAIPPFNGATINGLTSQRVTATTNAVNRKIYLADTTAGLFQINLPSGVEDKVIGVIDAGPYFGTNKLTCYPGGVADSIDTGSALEGIELDINRMWIFFYQAAGSSVWEIQSNILAVTSTIPATNTVAGSITAEYNTVQTKAIVGATTSPNVFVKQSKVGKVVNITVSALSSVTKDAASGPIKFQIDTEYRPEDSVAFIKPSKQSGAWGGNWFQITSAGWVEMYQGLGGTWFPPGTTDIAWLGNLSFTYSLY